MGNIHKVVGAIITADPWWPTRILLMKRKVIGERFWPGVWCYLTEHIDADESDEDAIFRGMAEETGLKPVIICGGPVIDNIIDPDYKESFEMRVYQCIPNGRIPALNEENTRYTWTTPSIDIPRNATLRNEPIFPHFLDHVQRVREYRLWGEDRKEKSQGLLTIEQQPYLHEKR